MAANDDLDDFFKKIDRKGNKHKKQTTLLTNNEELHKQLVIVTSATSAFKENMDFDEDDDEEIPVNNHTRHQFITESNGITGPIEDGLINKNQSDSTSINNKIKSTTKLSVQDNNNNFNEQQPGDEWEEFEDPNSKYNQLRLKFSGIINNGEKDDEDYDDENNHPTNFDEKINNIDGENGDQLSRNNRRREQQKDKPAWKVDQVEQTSTNDGPTEKIEEPSAPSASKPATSGAYRPPQLRGNSAVTVVSGVHQRVSKKEKPNLASTEDFPTLGAAVNKK
jgi:hypothetical protein